MSPLVRICSSPAVLAPSLERQAHVSACSWWRRSLEFANEESIEVFMSCQRHIPWLLGSHLPWYTTRHLTEHVYVRLSLCQGPLLPRLFIHLLSPPSLRSRNECSMRSATKSGDTRSICLESSTKSEASFLPQPPSSPHAAPPSLQCYRRLPGKNGLIMSFHDF